MWARVTVNDFEKKNLNVKGIFGWVSERKNQKKTNRAKINYDFSLKINEPEKENFVDSIFSV